MKKIIIILISTVCFSSCDVIEGPYMIDNGTIPVDTTSNNFVKKVLIEDYTGHTCPNCPDAARQLEAIQEFYGDQVIGIAVHIGKAFARPYPESMAPKFQYEFRTKWGEEWDGFFDITTVGLPRGMINRTEFPDDYRLGKDNWSERVISELEKDPEFGIIITPEINGNSGTIDISVEALKDISGTYNIVVCLTESGIIDWQKDGSIEIEDYEHNHVLRTILNDGNGEEIGSSFTEGDKWDKTYSINISDLEQFNIYHSNNTLLGGNGNTGDWNTTNMQIVAFVYDITNYEISQVEEVHLITE